MIRRVRIKGYKSLRDVDLSLAPLTVVFGANAAGKSNLHDALGLLSRLGTMKTLQDAFDPKVHRGTSIEAFSYGPAGLDELLRAERAQMTIEVDVELSSSVIDTVEIHIKQLQEGLANVKARRHVTERFLRYRVAIELIPSTGVLRVVDEFLAATNSDGTLKRRTPFIEQKEGRIHLKIERQSHPSYHEVGLNYTLVSSQLYSPHYPHITALQEELSRWHFYFLEPDMMRQDAPIQAMEVLDHDGSELAPFYFTLKQRAPKRFKGLTKALAMLIPLVQDLDVNFRAGGLLELSIREGGAQFSSRLISEGTLRVLGLLAITNPLEPVSVVGYEEPENGVHPRRLRLIAELFANAREGDTQYLINTHSPFVVEALQSTASVTEALRGTDDVTLLACRQDVDGRTAFEVIDPLPLLSRPIVQGILEGEYGG